MRTLPNQNSKYKPFVWDNSRDKQLYDQFFADGVKLKTMRNELGYLELIRDASNDIELLLVESIDEGK